MLDTCIFGRTGSSGMDVTENRRIKINYPGSGNNSQFTYDGLGHNVTIIETASGTVNGTTQFVLTGNRKAETRNSSGSLISQFFNYGEKIAGNQYYFTRNQLGSVTEMANNTAILQAAYLYNSYGRVMESNVSVEADFGYAGYYRHMRSGTLWPSNRQYQPAIGRWLSRDPLGEYAGANLYEFALNAPMLYVDPSGLEVVQVTDPKANKGLGHCAYLVGNDADGWDYYSFAPNGVTSGHYPSLGGFYGSNGRYTSGTLYPTTPAQDQAARDSASNYSAADYKPFRCNCADFAEAGMNAAGISTHDSFGPNVPVRLTGSGGYDVSPPVMLPDPPHGPIAGEQ